MFFLLPQSVFAVELFLTTAEENLNKGDTFIVDVRVDSQGECINVVDVDITFDNSALQIIDLGRGESLVSLWIENEIVVDQTGGRVHFSGGIPGGYCGRVQGDPGLTNNIAKLVFTTLGQSLATTTQVSISESSKVLLNNERGEEATLIRKNLQLAIQDVGAPIKNEWLQVVRADATAPEFFEVLIYEKEGVSKWDSSLYIIFNTTDKQSGISHYEVLETNPLKYGFDVRTGRESRWETITSPYFLKDQTLSSKIFIKAVDKAGNERIAEVLTGQPILRKAAISLGVQIIVVLVLIGAVVLIRRRMKKKKETSVEEVVSEEPNHNDHNE